MSGVNGTPTFYINGTRHDGAWELEQLLEVFFTVAHAPTQRNRQGPDVGTQYRSIVFYGDSVQRRIAQAYVAGLTTRRAYAAPIVTEIAPLETFYPAEAYHQHYMQRH